MSSILSVKELSKVFTNSHTKKELKILDNVNFDISAGQSFAIVGPSGSGKTTLLGLCAGLDQVTTGSIILNSIKLDNLNEDQLAKVRNEHVGFVFQNFQLIPTLTALENVMIPLELRGEKHAEKTSKDLLARVGLGERMGHYPVQLSGGEQQRVSIARAFSNNPKILFADEPTGNLDEETSNSIEELIFEINKEAGTTLVIVTHDLELAAKTDRRIRLKGGKIISNS
ncbi:MAG: ABC transporter ATP-binding protein [Bacteroidota bacterium]